MNEIERRRTFAIISHPDAGKTTLTEKLLLFGGQIQVAGAVKSNKIKKEQNQEDRHLRLDGNRKTAWNLRFNLSDGVRLQGL